MASGIVAQVRVAERQQACTANREHLVHDADETLRPRRRDAFSGADLGVEDGAFLQADVRAGGSITFFMQYFEQRVLRRLPRGGVQVIVHSRFIEQIPPASDRVCQEDLASDDCLTMRVYNLS